MRGRGPRDLGFYCPITTRSGTTVRHGNPMDVIAVSISHFGPTGVGNRNRLSSGYPSAGDSVTDRRISAGFASTEGTAVKIRDGNHSADDKINRPNLALQSEARRRIHDTYFSYFFAADEKTMADSSASVNKYNKQKPSIPYGFGSFVGGPGPRP